MKPLCDLLKCLKICCLLESLGCQENCILFAGDSYAYSSTLQFNVLCTLAPLHREDWMNFMIFGIVNANCWYYRKEDFLEQVKLSLEVWTIQCPLVNCSQLLPGAESCGIWFRDNFVSCPTDTQIKVLNWFPMNNWAAVK